MMADATLFTTSDASFSEYEPLATILSNNSPPVSLPPQTNTHHPLNRTLTPKDCDGRWDGGGAGDVQFHDLHKQNRGAWNENQKAWGREVGSTYHVDTFRRFEHFVQLHTVLVVQLHAQTQQVVELV
jgi:hypothetical protein